MLRLLVFVREQDNKLRCVLEAVLHHAHEVGVFEILVLRERRQPGLVDNTRDQLGGALVRAGPRNEKVRMCRRPAHAPLRRRPRKAF